MSSTDSNLQHSYIRTNGVTLHVVQAGPEEGPLVILLHGFPEFWYGWRRQIDALAEAGFRVWAPDQRGYNLSDKPKGKEAYTLDKLAGDVVGLIAAADRTQATVVGHDFGAAVGWWMARDRPELLARFVAINVPHGAVFSRALRSDPVQRRKSRYMSFLRTPFLAEKMIRRADHRILQRTLVNSSREGTFTDGELQKYVRAWSQPKALTSMLNWYKALTAASAERPASVLVTPQTLIIWGEEDKFLSKDLAVQSMDFCDDARLVYLDATHWVHLEQPEQVNKLLIDFLGGYAPATVESRPQTA